MSLSKQEMAYLRIRERILSGHYSPGYRLVIAQLARELGVSAIPVREAVHRLNAEGIVVFNRHTGAMVAPVNESAYVDTLRVGAVIEAYATAVAAPYLGPADFQRLREINAQMEDAMAALDFVRFGRLNREFHLTIYEHCPNAYLVECIRRGLQRLDQVRHSVFGFIPARPKRSVEEHEELIKALENGAPASEIEAAARQHKLNTVSKFHEWASENLREEQGAKPKA